MARLSGRAALVTGGGRGIGRAIAERLAAEGADVAINYRSDTSAADAVAEGIRRAGGRAAIYQFDVANSEAVEEQCRRVIEDFPHLSILVNNAGIGSAAVNRPTIAEGTLEQWNLLLGANLWGPILLCRALIPRLREAERSDVVMISSIAAQLLGKNSGLYGVGKAGAEALAMTLAKEERDYGVRVNVVAPGLVDTDMGRRLVGFLTGSDDVNALGGEAPFGYICTPADISGTVAHLCSEDGRYITGQRITIDGGG